MIKMTNSQIRNILSKTELDIRKTGDGRWIDQKCTPDILSVVADLILTFLREEKNNLNYRFTNREIWHSDKTNDIFVNIFKKPKVSEITAQNEYDKIISQPMKLFAAAGILHEYHKEGPRGSHLYELKQLELLEYISYREKNALDFLCVYIEMTLSASGLIDFFNVFFQKQTAESYITLKTKFSDFTHKETNITGRYEPNRIFTKVINPLAFARNLKGSERGRISKYPITYDMLMYNRDNFRDIYNEKPKNMTREEYIEEEGLHINESLTEYQITKAKKIVREYNKEFQNSKTEHFEEDEYHHKATHIHHIFPKSEYVDIAACIENLIALTPNQHLLKAHKDNHTHYVDKAYQHELLLSKLETIFNDLDSESQIYSVEDFKYVLSVGFQDPRFAYLDSDYNSIKEAINQKHNESTTKL